MAETRILSLDTASKNTGYAIMINDKIKRSGTWHIKQKQVYLDLYTRILQTIEDFQINSIIAEDIFLNKNIKSPTAYQKLAECRGILELISQQVQIPIEFINPLAVKRYMNISMYTSIGSTTRQQQKDMMIRKVKAKGYKLENDEADDEADAIGMLLAYTDK